MNNEDNIVYNHSHDQNYLKLGQKEIKFETENYIGYDEDNKLYIRDLDQFDYIYNTGNKPTLEELDDNYEFINCPYEITSNLNDNAKDKLASTKAFKKVYEKTNLINNINVTESYEIDNENPNVLPSILLSIESLNKFKQARFSDFSNVNIINKNYMIYIESDNVKYELNNEVVGVNNKVLLVYNFVPQYDGVISAYCNIKNHLSGYFTYYNFNDYRINQFIDFNNFKSGNAIVSNLDDQKYLYENTLKINNDKYDKSVEEFERYINVIKGEMVAFFLICENENDPIKVCDFKIKYDKKEV